MKFKILVTSCLCIIMGCTGSKDLSKKAKTVSTDTDSLLSYQKEITPVYLHAHLAVLAADSMEGRETTKPGQKNAARYLVTQYQQMGLKSPSDGKSYLQKFDVISYKRDSVVFNTYKKEGYTKKLFEHSVASKTRTANYIRAFGGTDTLSGDIIFAGFGVVDSVHNVNNLDNLDLTGKWVLVFQEIPHVINGDTLISPDINRNRRLGEIIRQRGAEGMLLIPRATVNQYQAAAMQMQNEFQESKGMKLKYLDNGKPPKRGFSKGYTVINPALAAQLLGIENGANGLEAFRQTLIDNLQTFSSRPTDFSLTQKPYSSKVTKETENVMAWLEGSDPVMKNQIVVLSAHYDHLGIGRPDSTGDRIYNGADDDGSGTVGVLNIARALAEAKKHGFAPKRSILFLHVTGEEKGLLGSRYYSDHPIFPIEQTIADLNTDMIGRIDPEHEKEGEENYTYVIGSEIISSQMDSLLKVANAQSGNVALDKKYNDLNDSNQFYRRSDHWNFGRLGIPFIFFFTGVHKDYHRPGDEVQKIRFEKMTKIVRTIFATTIEVANTETPPKVDNQEFINATKLNPW